MELHQMWRTKRYGLAVLPRQTGKDVAASMEQMRGTGSRHRRRRALYISLNNPMIRDILWDKTYLDPALRCRTSRACRTTCQLK
jgi:hypothetical protein